MDQADEDETKLLARFIDARVWARHEAGIPESVARCADIVSRAAPNTTLSLDYLRSRYPGVYGPGSNWLTFLRTGVGLLHVPSDAFQRHMDVQAAVGLLVGLRPGSALQPYAREAALANPVYAATLGAAFNEIDDGFFFSPRTYYRLNPDVLEAAAPAHVHFLLTGCFEQRAISPDIKMSDYADARTVELDRRIDELRAKLHWRSAPQSRLLCALAHMGLDCSVPELFERYTGRRLPYPARRRKPRPDRPVPAHRPLPAGAALDRSEQDIAKIRGRGLLDRAFYLRSNPDVASARLDPVRHYVAVGEGQGRFPRADFDPLSYLALRWDVRRQGGNALVHASEAPRPAGAPSFTHGRSGECVLLIGANGQAGDDHAPLAALAAWTFQHTGRRVVTVLLGQGGLGEGLACYGPTLVLPDPAEEADWLRRFLAPHRVAVIHGYGRAAADFLGETDADLFRTAKIVLHACADGDAEARPPMSPADRWVCYSSAAHDRLAGLDGVDPASICLLPPLDGLADDAALSQLEAFLWNGITRPGITVVVPQAAARDGLLQALLAQSLRNVQVIRLGVAPGDATRDPRVEDVPVPDGNDHSPAWLARAMARARARFVWLAAPDDDVGDPGFLSRLSTSTEAMLTKQDVVDTAGRVLGSLFTSAGREAGVAGDCRLTGDPPSR